MTENRNIHMGEGNYNEYEQKGNFGIGHMSGGEIKGNAKVAVVIDEKSLLIEEIVTQGTEGRDLSDADLRGADLRGAYLIGAYLRNTKIDEKTKLDPKWRKVWEIVNQGAKGQDLSDADLSDANLRSADLRSADLIGAYLSGAYLRSADLSDADLSGANVKNTRFSDNKGISESLKQDLITRGAIFEDSPGDRSEVDNPTPV